MTAVVLDTSVVIAILRDEPIAGRIVDALAHSETRRISAASLLESSIVMYARYGDAGDRELDLLIHRLGVGVVPVTREQIDIARAAFRRFGKGQHPAALNFGDCFSYALARSLDEPLMFTGDDFSRTDIEAADY